MNILNFEIIENEYFYKEKKLNPTKNSQGYLYVTINGKRKRLHRLIALRYISNPNNYKIVGHKDDVKTNNNLCNLYWTSHKQNTIKAFKSNKNMQIMHKGERPVIAIKGNVKICFKSVRQAARILQRDAAAVVRCCQGEWKTCNGYKLSYKQINKNIKQ